MLAIRMQRTGRRGHAQFRMIVQDSRLNPSSGRVVAYLGNYDPHTKVAAFDKEKTAQYLKNGAQPSDRVIGLLKKEGVKLPDWVKESAPGQRKTRYPEKLRRNRPAGEAQAEQPTSEEQPAEETPAEEQPAPKPAEETPAEQPTEPAQETAEEEKPADS